MVYLNPPITEDYASRPLRSSSYYDTLKKFGKLKTDVPVRNKTASYEKHLLPHTDVTGGGHGNSYPHKRDFAWNLLYLKQSWGSDIRSLRNANASKTSDVTRKSTSSSVERNRRSTADVNLGAAPNRLCDRTSRTSFRLAATQESKRGERKRQTVGSDQSRGTLDSIPEHGPLTSLQSRSLTTDKSTKRRHVISSMTKASRGSHKSRKSNSRISTSSSVMSSRLPSVSSGREAISSTNTMRSYESESRLSSVMSRSTQWDEYEGRPAAEKMLARAQPDRKVANTIRPDVLKTLVGEVTGKLNTRERESHHLDSAAVASVLGSNYSVKRHQPFTNLSFEVEKSAMTTRLRSSLYKTEEAQRKPTIFRSNLTEVKKHKSFNPRHHSDITRPVMIDKHAHKHPLEDYSPPKWSPKLNGLSERLNGPWTTYETR